MADRRRRRLSESENESGDELSQNTTATSIGERPSECESEGEHVEPDLSEYESAAESAINRSRDVAETEEESETETESDTDGSATAEEDSGDDVVVEEVVVVDEERQSGDGEEQPDENLDIDEDSKNPAYIPRKGAFYEHDMRLDPNEEPPPEEQPPRGKGKLWKDESKWSHDRYSEVDQTPRSRQELIALYGYDIMLSDQPPAEPPKMDRARRPPRKQRFEDYLPGDGGPPRRGNDRQGYRNRPAQDDEFPPPQSTRDDNDQGYRGRGRGGRGGGSRNAYSNMADRAERNKSYVERQRESGYNKDSQRDFPAENLGYRDSSNDSNRDNFRNNRDNYRDRNRENIRGDNRYGNRDNRPDNRFDNRNIRNERDSFDNRGRNDRDDRLDNRDNRPEQDNRYGNRDDRNNSNPDRTEQDRFGNRGNRFDNRDINVTEQDRFPNRENLDNRFDNQTDNRGKRNYRDNRDSGDHRPYNERGSDYRDNTRSNRNYQGSSGYDNRQIEDRPRNYRENDNPRGMRGGGTGSRNFRDNVSPRNFRDSRNRDDTRGPSRGIVQPDLSDIKGPISRQAQEPIQNQSTEQREKTPTETYRRPNPKSYYTLSAATDDEKLENLDHDDVESSPGPGDDAEEISVKLSASGDRKSYSRDRRAGNIGQTRSQDTVVNAVTRGLQNIRMEGDDDEPAHPNVTSSSTKHQSSLPPRLQQQQQQQQERKKQQQQQIQQQQQDKQDPSQGRSNKRYSSQRQRAPPDPSGFPDAPPSPTVAQSMSSQPQFKQEFSSQKPSANMQAQMMRPPPNFSAPVMAIPATSGGHMSPTTSQVPRVPPPGNQIPHPGPAVPPPRHPLAGQVPPPGVPVLPSPQMLPVRPFGTSAVTTLVPSVPMMPPPQLMTPAIIYATQPPPPAGFPIPAVLPPMPPQFPAAPPATALPPPPLTQAQIQETILRGTTYYPAETNRSSRPKSTGTTFYNPNMQMKPQSAARQRPKLAIPIVNPEHEQKDRSGSESEVAMDTPDSPLTTTPPLTTSPPLATNITSLQHTRVDPQTPPTDPDTTATVFMPDTDITMTTVVTTTTVKSEIGVTEKGDNFQTNTPSIQAGARIKTEPESPVVAVSIDSTGDKIKPDPDVEPSSLTKEAT